MAIPPNVSYPLEVRFRNFDGRQLSIAPDEFAHFVSLISQLVSSVPLAENPRPYWVFGAAAYRGSMRFPLEPRLHQEADELLSKLEQREVVDRALRAVEAVISITATLIGLYVGQPVSPQSSPTKFSLDVPSHMLAKPETRAALEQLLNQARAFDADEVSILLRDEEPVVLYTTTPPHRIGSAPKNRNAPPEGLLTLDFVEGEWPIIELDGESYPTALATEPGSERGRKSTYVLLWSSARPLPERGTYTVKVRQTGRALSALRPLGTVPSQYVNADHVLIVEGIQIIE